MAYIELNNLEYPVIELSEDGVIDGSVVGQTIGFLGMSPQDYSFVHPLFSYSVEEGYPYSVFYPGPRASGRILSVDGSFGGHAESIISMNNRFSDAYPTYIGVAFYQGENFTHLYFVVISNLSCTINTDITEQSPAFASIVANGTITDIDYVAISSAPIGSIIDGESEGLFIDVFSERTTPADPYEPGGYSGPNWGTGDFDGTSDIIGMPDFPSISAIDTGFLTLFTPSITQLQSLQEYLWTDLLEGIKDGSLSDIVDSLKKIVSDPYQAIMGLSIVPVAIPTGGSKDVKMYGVLDSGIVMPYASTQWVEVDCGSLRVNEFWGNYMDYAPYTKITSLYLPFVGVVSVDVDEIMGKTVSIKYRIDVLSGQCIAFIIINGSVEYQYQGHCATSIPITASDFSSTINAGLNLISHVTAGVAGIAGGALSGALSGGIGGALGAVGAVAGAANNIASDVMNAKPNIKAGSSVGGSGGLLSVKKPFFIAIRPKQCVAHYQKSFTGFPINETYAIRQLTGYTEFERINLDGIPLTKPEKEELESLLLGGVYL